MKRTRLRKEAKKNTMGWYKKEFWKVFSRYIRLRDKGKCFTCGLQKPWKTQQAGHMIPRASGGLSLYFHEQNVNCQCYRCNINLGGNGAVYAVKFVEKYGQDAFDEVMRLKDQGYLKYGIDDYEQLRAEYEVKVEKLIEEYEDN
jgi:hypothetical protein